MRGGEIRRLSLFQRILERLNLRFPALFLIFLALTVLDLLIPDPIPFVDEIGLALVTAMFALWKDRRQPSQNPRGPH